MDALLQQAKAAANTAASNNDNATPPPPLDTNLLRNAIRLIHCLQKERGSSCAYYADHQLFESAMLEARTSSDISAGLIQHHTELPISSNLSKIRNLIEANSKTSPSPSSSLPPAAASANTNTSNNTSPKENNRVLHRIFNCFNTLISSVVHECILNQIHMHGGQNNNETSKTKSTIKRHNHRKGLSMDINDRLANIYAATPPGDSFEFSQGSHSSSASPPVTLSPSPHRNLNSNNNNNKKVQFNGNDMRPTKVQQILNLLHLFVQLKESSGIERAILSSHLALRNQKDPSLNLLMNDLILEVEKQRSLIHQLEHLPDGPHRNLVLDLGQMSPQLLELQTIILTDMESLAKDEYDPEAIWDLITLYVEKLHSVELLLVEELECSIPSSLHNLLHHRKRSSLHTTEGQSRVVEEETTDDKKNDDDDNKASENNQTTTETSQQQQHQQQQHALEDIFKSEEGTEALISQLQNMSPDDVKRRLLEALKLEDWSTSQNGGTMPDTVNGSGPNHYSAAAHLEEDMKKALDNRLLSRAASKEWGISIYEIKFLKRIGQGASATTYLANWSNQNVAVKVASITQFGQHGWETEVATLQRLHHPNVIRLLGCVYNENPLTFCLVLEYCNAGDLATALKYPTPKNFFFHVANSIANAMTYLHSRNVIHRDLKPGNVLCDGNITSGNFTVKVTDFGVAADYFGQQELETNVDGTATRRRKNLTGETGTYRWMAPEVIRHEPYTNMADVYSFAIMLWQLVTHEEPFWDISAAEAANVVAIQRKRPPIPSGTPSAIQELIQSNWSDNQENRWEFSKLSETLTTIKESLSAEERTFMENCYGNPVYEEDNNNNNNNNEKSAPEKSDVKATKKDAANKAGKNPNKGSALLSGFFGNIKRSDKNKRGSTMSR